MNYIEKELDLFAETKGHIDLVGIVATFRLEEDRYTPEPRSYATHLPREVSVWEARITSAQVGQLILSRDQLALVVGEEPIRRADEAMTTSLNDLCGDYAA